MLTEEDDMKEGWRSYFDQLMNVENERIQSKVPAREEGRVWIVLGEEEVRKALSKMKKWKAVGPDDIPVEAWRALEGKGVTWLTEILCRLIASEKMPDEWRHSKLIPIYKNKGDIQECGNYRGIKLMSHSLKISERVIENRLRGTVTMSDQQFGFMPGRSTTDAIFALMQLMEKCREVQRNLHCVFIDLEKAYDRGPQMEVWNCLREKGVGEKVIRLIQDMYEGSRTRVRTVAGVTADFEVKVGLHQGSALSPLLFAIVMDCITGPLQRDGQWDMLLVLWPIQSPNKGRKRKAKRRARDQIRSSLLILDLKDGKLQHLGKQEGSKTFHKMLVLGMNDDLSYKVKIYITDGDIFGKVLLKLIENV